MPFPHAAEDHQTVNAQKLVDVNAAIMVKDKDATESLIPQVIQLVKDEKRRMELADNIAKLAITNADEIIADKILEKLNS